MELEGKKGLLSTALSKVAELDGILARKIENAYMYPGLSQNEVNLIQSAVLLIKKLIADYELFSAENEKGARTSLNKLEKIVKTHNSSFRPVYQTDDLRNIRKEIGVLIALLELAKFSPEKTKQVAVKSKLVFISYSSEDKRLAGQAKQTLEKYGLEGFLAHEDIVSDRWLPVIESNLEQCFCLIALITENFDNRWWTNQEIGYVIGAGKKVFPVFMKKPNRDSMGFLPEYQGETNVTEENFNEKIESLVKKILKNI